MTPSTHAPNRVRVLSILVAVPLLVAGCLASGSFTRIGSPPYERGSGTAATEHRTLAPFHEIDAAQAIQVVVRSGTSDEATVSFDDNLLAHIDTVVEDGILRVRFTGNVETRLVPRVDVVATGHLDGIAADSGASVEARDLDGASLAIRATSAATVRLAGRADRVDLSLDTAGVAELGDLTVADATVQLSTASRATIHAEGSISGSCVLASKLELVGQPRSQTVTTDTTSEIHGR